MIYEPLRKTSDFAYMASYICMHIFHHTFTHKKKGNESGGGHRENGEHWTNT